MGTWGHELLALLAGMSQTGGVGLRPLNSELAAEAGPTWLQRLKCSPAGQNLAADGLNQNQGHRSGAGGANLFATARHEYPAVAQALVMT